MRTSTGRSSTVGTPLSSVRCGRHPAQIGIRPALLVRSLITCLPPCCGGRHGAAAGEVEM
jgi:hypothetical protein